MGSGIELEQAADRIRVARIGLGLTQAELANLLGVTRETVARWEGGTSKYPPRPGVLADLQQIENTHSRHIAEGIPAGEDWPQGWRDSVRFARKAVGEPIPGAGCYYQIREYRPGEWGVAVLAIHQRPITRLDQVQDDLANDVPGVDLHDILTADDETPIAHRPEPGQSLLWVDQLRSRHEAIAFCQLYEASTGRKEVRRDAALAELGYQV